MKHDVVVEPDDPDGREAGYIRNELRELSKKSLLEQQVRGRIQARDLKPEHQERDRKCEHSVTEGFALLPYSRPSLRSWLQTEQR